MSTYKVRLWDSKTKVMTYSDKVGLVPVFDWYETNLTTCTIMDYIHRQDSLGKDIYEADILHCLTRSIPIYLIVKHAGCRVENLLTHATALYPKTQAKNLTVIGNVYESPLTVKSIRAKVKEKNRA